MLLNALVAPGESHYLVNYHDIRLPLRSFLVFILDIALCIAAHSVLGILVYCQQRVAMASFSNPKGCTGKRPVHPLYPGNKLHRMKFFQSLELAGLGENLCPRFPSPRKSPFVPLVEEIVVFPDQLVVGLRWPLPSEVIGLCEDLGVAPSQLASNYWRAWFALMLWSKGEGRFFSHNVFRYFYRLIAKDESGFCYFTPRSPTV